MKTYHLALLSQHEPNEAIGRAFISEFENYDYAERDWNSIRTKYGVEVLRSQILKDVNGFKPDLIFMQLQTAGILDTATLLKLKEKSFVVNWTGDVRENINWYAESANSVDVTLFTNMTDVEKMRAVGLKADYLQIGFDDQIYTPVGTKSIYPEIVFLGNSYDGFPLSAERRNMVKFLSNKFTNRFQVYGHGWNSRHLKPAQEAECYRSCKIAINQNHFDYKRFSSDRILRIMGSGAFCLTKHYEGIEEDFVNGMHLVTWKSFDELEQMIKFYLEHESLRKKIAENGKNLVRENYTWRNRIHELKKIVHKYDEHYKTPRSENWVEELNNIKSFKTHSQNGEEGYLTYILSNIGMIRNGFVVDLGAGDGRMLSNTRYLIEHRSFKAILIDVDNHGNDQVIQSWITRENIIKLLKESNCPTGFDLLSIDLDGNDYHVLKEVLSVYSPLVIIAEINPKFGRDESFAIRYNPHHSWDQNDYYGMSLAALEKLAEENSYKVVFVSDSLNAYLVKENLVPVGSINLKYEQKYDFPIGEGEWIEIK